MSARSGADDGVRRPKYERIATDLAARIRAGEYAPGSALPRQRDLSATYGVTLATLRQALQVLESDGLVSQQAGRGTFVAEPKVAYQLDTLHSLADDLRAHGYDVLTRVVGAAVCRIPAAVTAHLGEGRALRLERVRLVGGAPAVHQVSWIAEPYGDRVARTDFTEVPLYRALAAEGVVVHRATERLRPDLLSEQIAVHLERPAVGAVFVSERTTFGIDGVAVVFDRATILGDTMEVRAERAATRLSLRWNARDAG